jgi:hypothetical protein
MLLGLSATLMVATAAIHSVLGERRLITPILRLDSKVTNAPLARKLLRCAWHVTSLLMILNAVVVVWPGSPLPVVAITGIVWLLIGLFDAVYTRGQHLGWPFLTGAGLFALLGIAW